LYETCHPVVTKKKPEPAKDKDVEMKDAGKSEVTTESKNDPMDVDTKEHVVKDFEEENVTPAGELESLD
jgi:hypothetical protein